MIRYCIATPLVRLFVPPLTTSASTVTDTCSCSSFQNKFCRWSVQTQCAWFLWNVKMFVQRYPIFNIFRYVKYLICFYTLLQDNVFFFASPIHFKSILMAFCYSFSVNTLGANVLFCEKEIISIDEMDLRIVLCVSLP